MDGQRDVLHNIPTMATHVGDAARETLVTPRLVLRPLAGPDLAPFVRLLTDPEVCRHMGGAVSPAEAEARFARLAAPQADRLVWAARDAQAGRYVGHGGLLRADSPATMELLYVVAPDHQGRGFATEIARALVAHATARMDVRRVVARVDEDHGASIRVLERAGLRLWRRARDDEGPYLVYARDADEPRTG